MGNQTKEKIKEVAFALFAAKGYEATSIADIAAGVGVTKPALYAHFSGKEELFLSIHEDIENDYNNYMEQIFQETELMDIPKKLYHVFERYMMYFLINLDKNSFWYRVMLFPPQDLKDKLSLRVVRNEEKFSRRVYGIFSEGIKQGIIRSGSVEIMVAIYYSLREGQLLFASFFQHNERCSDEMVVERIKAVWNDYWQGIKGV